MKKITYVTGNWAKVESAKHALEPLGFEIDNIKMETPEIQAEDVDKGVEKIAKYFKLTPEEIKVIEESIFTD